MRKYGAQKSWLYLIIHVIYASTCLTAPASSNTDFDAIPIVQPFANLTKADVSRSHFANSTALENFIARGLGYPYYVPNSNTWLKFRFHVARKIEHNSLVYALISAIDETLTDISIFGGHLPVNENAGPFNQHTPGCMFTISSTRNPDKVRRMTYSMRLDTLRGLMNVLVKGKRETAAEFIIYYEGLGLVGVGTIDNRERRSPLSESGRYFLTFERNREDV